MTRNQIAWFEANERARANLVAEEETRRANFARESEQTRHNLELEDQGRKALVETNRSNQAQEELKRQDLVLRDKYNRDQLVLSYKQFAEVERSNKARERIAFQNAALEKAKVIESQRHNYATESVARMEHFRQLQRDKQQNALAYRNYREVRRSNRAREAMESRKVRTQEQDAMTRLRTQREQERTNRQKENVSWFNAYSNAASSAMKATASVIPLLFV